jgi:hypothetical protein
MLRPDARDFGARAAAAASMNSSSPAPSRCATGDDRPATSAQWPHAPPLAHRSGFRVLRLGANRLGSPGSFFSRAIATILGRSFIKRVPVWFDFALIGAVMLVSCYVPRWSKGRTLAAGAVALVGYRDDRAHGLWHDAHLGADRVLSGWCFSLRSYRSSRRTSKCGRGDPGPDSRKAGRAGSR